MSRLETYCASPVRNRASSRRTTGVPKRATQVMLFIVSMTPGGTPTPECADVLIIGAGASGGIAARRLLDAGYSVVCLEQGEWPQPSPLRGEAPEWELLQRKQWNSLPQVRQLPAD